MNYETITALISFALVSSITPGPNNIMLMSSGTNFGFKKTIPHIAGVNLGFTLMVFLVGMGLMQLFNAYPFSQTILQVFSVLYLVYLAYKIATSTSPSGGVRQSSRPMTFIQAVLFQWVNPKAWTMALTAVSLYSPSGEMTDILKVAMIFWIANLPCITMWVMLGGQIRKFLTNAFRLKSFNYTMASLLIGSLYLTFSA